MHVEFTEPYGNTCWFSKIWNYRQNRQNHRALTQTSNIFRKRSPHIMSEKKEKEEKSEKEYYTVAAISIHSQQGRERFAESWSNENPREIEWRKVRGLYDEEPGFACDTRDKFNELPLGSSLKISQKGLLLKEELRISNISQECENDSRFSPGYLNQSTFLKYIYFSKKRRNETIVSVVWKS